MKRQASRIWKRTAAWAIVCAALWFVLMPFPGAGMIYLITDTLHGHPHRPHGKHPQSLVGLWVKEEPVPFGMLANALSLTEKGKIGRSTGMSSYTWHCEGSRLSIDSISHCGNCYAGTVTQPFEVKFEGTDRVLLTPLGRPHGHGVEGWYRLTTITPELRREMQRRLDTARLDPASDDVEYSLARSVIDAIDHIAPQLATLSEGPHAQK